MKRSLKVILVMLGIGVVSLGALPVEGRVWRCSEAGGDGGCLVCWYGSAATQCVVRYIQCDDGWEDWDVLCDS